MSILKRNASRKNGMPLARELEISGVPTYIVNDKYAIVGAQPYQVFQRVLARLENEA